MNPVSPSSPSDYTYFHTDLDDNVIGHTTELAKTGFAPSSYSRGRICVCPVIAYTVDLLH
jgi:hypothetical protein